MRDVVLIAGPEGDTARRLGVALLACDLLVWAFVAWSTSAGL